MTQLPRRVGINAIFLEPNMGGLVTYVEELVPELLTLAPATRLLIYCSPVGERHLRRLAWSRDVQFVTHRLFGAAGLKAIMETTLLGALAGQQVDLLHSVALTAPLATHAANVVTIADTIWIQGDRPDLTTRLWRTIVPTVARRADRIIAISQAGARDIEDHLRVPRSRIDVTLLGHRDGRSAATPDEELRARLHLGEGPIVLMVGTRKPHKNVLGLLNAMPALCQAVPAVQLVLAGNPTAHEPELLAERDRLALGGHVRLLPNVPREDLEGLYAAATVFVLPSTVEGFGLPIVEAMGRGVPVACSNVSALPEVAGGAARLFDPHDPTEIAAALAELLLDPDLREQLRTRGRARERQLTWRATAEATLESYARAWSARRMPTATAFASG